MELKTFFAQDTSGNVIANPTVYVYAPNTTILATGLQTAAGAALTNPFNGTDKGRITLAAPDGTYDLRIVGAGRDTTIPVRFISVAEAMSTVAELVNQAEEAVSAAQAAAQAADESANALIGAGGSSHVGYDGETVQDVLDKSKKLASYTALRAYTGRATSVQVTHTGTGGVFNRDDADTSSADDGGVVIVDGSGRRWKRKVAPDDKISAAWFGAVAGLTSEQDTCFQKWASYLSTLVGFKAVIPPGQYLLADPTSIVSTTIYWAELEATGAEFIITRATATSNTRYFRIANTNRTGNLCRVVGLRIRHNRPTTRIEGTDMVSLAGFRNYQVEHIEIPSADNMGLVFGRDDPDTYCPDSITVLCPKIGGHYESTPHSHAPIGDTGIWVTVAAKTNHIISPVVTGTGDDAILVGHSSSPYSGGCFITDADIQKVSSGISCSVPFGLITGRVKRTNNTALWLLKLNTPGSQSGDMKVQLHTSEVGWLQAGEIGTAIIGKDNPHALFVYQGGSQGGQIDFNGSSVDGCLGRAVIIQPSAEFGGDISGIYGTVKCRRIGESEAGVVNSDAAVLWRAPTGGDAAVSKVDMTFNVRDTKVPFINWATSGTNNDDKIDLKFIAFDCSVDAAYLNQRLFNFEPSGGRAGRPTNVSIDLDLHRCTFGNLLRAPTLLESERQQIRIQGKDETGDINWTRKSFRVGNSANAKLLKGKTMRAARDATIGSLLAEFDISKTWSVEVYSVYAAGAKTGGYLKFIYSPNPAAYSSGVVTVLNDTLGTDATGYEAVINTSNTNFTGGALEVRSKSTGFNSGAFSRALIVAQQLEDFSSTSFN